MKALVVGGAGFIGSHLVDALVQRGDEVTVLDNLSNGQHIWVNDAAKFIWCNVIPHDECGQNKLDDACAGQDIVFHLAANPEARAGLENTYLDLEHTRGCHAVLEACRRGNVRKFFLASSGTVYGPRMGPCKEIDLGQLPISLYGESKLACEALCAAYSEAFGLRTYIARFGNVVGPRATHGCIYDFCNKLIASEGKYLDVLGNGTQQKPYLHVSDCVAGILHITQQPNAGAAPGIFNLAPPDTTVLANIARWVVKYSPYPNAQIRYSSVTESKGWKGDVAFSQLDASKIMRTGFNPNGFLRSDTAVSLAVSEIVLERFL